MSVPVWWRETQKDTSKYVIVVFGPEMVGKTNPEILESLYTMYGRDKNFILRSEGSDLKNVMNYYMMIHDGEEFICWTRKILIVEYLKNESFI